MKPESTGMTESRMIIVDRLNGSAKKKLEDEICKGLSAPVKYVSSKFFYDSDGSRLFEEITRLPEYYPGRTEKWILRKQASLLMSDLGSGEVIELGSGDCSKIKILFDAVPEENISELVYLPVDFSRSSIEKASRELLKLFPDLRIQGYVADFLHQLDYLPRRQKRLFCFFGGTIGNLTPVESGLFLTAMRQNMQRSDEFLLGLDMVKDTGVLEEAYNDSQKITARFNKNILKVVNATIGTDFDARLFQHRAFFNHTHSRVEMHLEALTEMEVRSGSHGVRFTLRKGEFIHTENSYKFTIDDIYRMSLDSGLKVHAIYQDPNEWFSLVRLGV